MSAGLDLSPVPQHERTASLVDVALLFAGANVVTSTLVTGGTLGASTRGVTVLAAGVLGILLGTLPVAALARLGPRTGLPSMVLLRRPFGLLGAHAISLLLILTNFAWIALNNVIAASALERLLGGDFRLWVVAVGGVAVLIAAFGPAAMARFDRFAVPLMAAVGLLLTWALVRAPSPGEGPLVDTVPAGDGLGFLPALDLVIAYQVSWALMFADYTRYQRRERSATLAVLLGLTLSSLWLLFVGARAAAIGGSNDPTEMILGVGLPRAVLILVVLSTITTNFVNLYLSSLALKTLRPSLGDLSTVLAVGAVGTGLGVVTPRLLDRYAGFMGLLATLFLPLVAVLLVHFFWRPGTAEHTRSGLETEPRRLAPRAWAAWAAGVVTYQLVSRAAPHLGATLPTLLLAALVYGALRPRGPGARASTRRSAPDRGVPARSR